MLSTNLIVEQVYTQAYSLRMAAFQQPFSLKKNLISASFEFHIVKQLQELKKTLYKLLHKHVIEQKKTWQKHVVK